MLVNADIIENIAALFESKTAAEKDATAVKRGIKSAISKSRIQTARVKAIQEKWDKKFAKPTSCIKQTYNYTIKNGDQLEIIAKKANTTISTIKRLNPMITDEETIFTGTIIKLPNPIK
ncbi:LysM peptidoglycan-binding domain-containing protein [Olleya sp. YSTF-M6]|uniref:LysM peptidoglycan-binding domain-containing protein n=1 Tax=Olleya sediminilitoris TaxID=2795739 RepID=A0ABS1WP56_9FLAO|nr:LysM domain-containing protein [Olleya sediminilitoris]MBL7560897.1 LysM peptidoglycan-binding domain-containing protein [Olleya sediminilitoris]